MEEVIAQALTQSFLEKHLTEVLLTVILGFNIGAYHQLRNRVIDVEADIESNEDEIKTVRASLKTLWKRLFGMDEDETMEGHLVETEERFDSIDSQLETICDKIDEESEQREKQFQELEDRLDEVMAKLSREENIDFSESDIRKMR